MNLASYRTAVLAKLDDVSLTRYTNNQIDEGLRSALAEYSRLAPIKRTYALDTDGNARLALPANFSASNITKVEYEHDSTTYDVDSSLPFEANYTDEGWVVEVYSNSVPIPSGQVITITYAIQHTIDDLDSAAGTTVRAQHETYLVLGGAGYTAISRSVARTEAINLNPAVASTLQNIGAAYLSEFRNGIARPSEPVITSPAFVEPTGF